MNLRFSRRARFLAYGLAGWAVDSLFVCIHTGRRRPSSLLNVPVYGLAQPLFEPVHDRIRQRPLILRATLYSAGILVWGAKTPFKRRIIPICRQNLALTPHRDDAEKLRG